MSKVLKAFKLNCQYRHERKETDSVMTRAIQEISIKKFFKGWRSLAGKRMGLLMFAETFEKLQLSALFKRCDRKALHEEETTAHISLLRDYLRLTKTFGALRRQSQRRDMDAAKTASFQKIRGLLSVKQHFREWRHRFA